MTRAKLVFRSLNHYWRAHLGVLLGTAIATAVLVGALAVGDSVRYTLRKIALDRLGDAAAAVAPQGRFFRAELGDVLGEQVDAPTAAVIQVEGLLRSGPTGARSSGVQASGVQVYGVDETFWKLAPAGGPPAADWADGIVLNPQLAETLDAEVGDELNLYVAKPSALPRDAPLARDDDLVESIANLKVTAIASVEQFGRFSLRANQVAPQVAFLPRDVLAGPIEQQGLANLLLIGGPDTQDRDAAAARAEQAAKALADSWQLEDVALQLHPLDERRFSVRTSRVFLDTPLVDAALEVDGNAYPVLTYFVNALAAGDKATPYSMVAAMNPPARPIPGKPATAKQTLPTGMKDDQIVITQWLADDLGIGVRDTLTLRYYVVGPRRTLTEASRDFQVVKVVGMDSPAIDRTLMPDFPGLDAANCRDWEPGIPIDTRKIRDKDEDYWDTYRGTPKAFVTLAAGREMWANRYGETTEVRFPAGYTEDELAAKIRSQIDPSVVGLAVLPVRADALDAASESLDFGQLFIGFSFFLIVAAVLLAALLFVFGVQQRTSQVGTLLALGYKPAQVRRLLTGEGLIVAVAGAVIGAPLGLLYTRGMLWGLATAWSDAVPSSQIAFHAAPTTVAIGAATSVVVAVFAMWLTLIRLSRRPVRQLQAAGTTGRIESPLERRRWVGPVGLVLTAGAAIAALLLRNWQGKAAAGAFFGVGAAMLLGTIFLSYALLSRLAGWGRAEGLTLAGLGVRSTARRRGRSVATLSLLACGAFLVVAVAANRQDPLAGTEQASSGTGGYTWFAELSTPVVHDLSSIEGQEKLKLEPDELQGVDFVQIRVKPGDDASCMNLNRAQQPQLLGLDPGDFDRQDAFTFTESQASEPTAEDAWTAALNTQTPPDVTPAVGDVATIVWGLGKGVGDELEYVDEFGLPFKVRIVGTIRNSIFQGSLLVSEDEFVRRYPSVSGYPLMLIDVPAGREEDVEEELRFGLEDYGLQLTSAPRRLAAFSQVEQAYLSIFGVVGGLGLLLGSCAMGVVVLRNILERRGELGVMRAVGFSVAQLRWMVLAEHWALLGLGLAAGVVSGWVAVLPALLTPGADVPVLTLVWVLTGVVVSGAIWVLLAALAGLRGGMLQAIRGE